MGTDLLVVFVHAVCFPGNALVGCLVGHISTGLEEHRDSIGEAVDCDALLSSPASERHCRLYQHRVPAYFLDLCGVGGDHVGTHFFHDTEVQVVLSGGAELSSRGFVELVLLDFVNQLSDLAYIQLPRVHVLNKLQIKIVMQTSQVARASQPNRNRA